MRVLAIVLGSIILAGASSSPADAARCKYGQIYRPSLETCMSKASAMRAGIFRARPSKARKARVAPRQVARPVVALLPKPAPVKASEPVVGIDPCSMQEQLMRGDPQMNLCRWVRDNRAALIQSLTD